MNNFYAWLLIFIIAFVYFLSSAPSLSVLFLICACFVLPSEYNKMKRQQNKTTSSNSNSEDELIEDLETRGEQLLSENIFDNEKIKVKLQGNFGQGLVITAKRIYILKWGFIAGNFFGGRCNVFEPKNIVSIEYKKGALTGLIEVLTPATQNRNMSYWATNKDDANKSDNAITFNNNKFGVFLKAAKIARSLTSS